MVSYQGRDTKDPGSTPIESRNAVIHMGGKGTVEAFTENLRGASPGEKREFDVTYPEDYPQKSLAGRIFRYAVTVESIKRKVLPALDDEMAKSVSNAGTLDDLRAQVREGMEKRRVRQAEQKVQSKRWE